MMLHFCLLRLQQRTPCGPDLMVGARLAEFSQGVPPPLRAAEAHRVQPFLVDNISKLELRAPACHLF